MMDRPTDTDPSVEGLFVKNVRPEWSATPDWTYGWMTGRRGSVARHVYEVRTTDGRLTNTVRAWLEVVDDTQI